MRTWAVLLVLLAVVSVIAAGSQRWAVVIGISDYQDDSIPTLTGAADAEAMRTVLVERCAVPQSNIWYLPNEFATLANIRHAVTEVTVDASEDDVVFIYFAGHGYRLEDRDGDEASSDGIDEALVPYDAVLGQEDTFLIDDMLGYLVSRIPAKTVVIILDTCYSGGQGRGMTSGGMSMRGPGNAVARDIFAGAETREGRILISACTASQVAYEDPDTGHGLLTEAFIKGIQNKAADSNLDRRVSIDEAAKFAHDQVLHRAREMGKLQTPEYMNPSARELVVVPSVSPTAWPGIVAKPGSHEAAQGQGSLSGNTPHFAIQGDLYLFGFPDFDGALFAPLVGIGWNDAFLGVTIVPGQLADAAAAIFGLHDPGGYSFAMIGTRANSTSNFPIQVVVTSNFIFYSHVGVFVGVGLSVQLSLPSWPIALSVGMVAELRVYDNPYIDSGIDFFPVLGIGMQF